MSDSGLSSRSESPSGLLRPRKGAGGEEKAIALAGVEDDGLSGGNVQHPDRGWRAGAFHRSPGAENRNLKVERGGGGGDGGALVSLRNGLYSRRALGKSPGGGAKEDVISAGQENSPPASKDRVVSVFVLLVPDGAGQ